MDTDSFVLTVTEVIEETAETRSVVFDLPEELRERFDYTPGQFLTVAVPSDRTGLVARCYSLSNAPHDPTYRITVKRHPDGYASNWIHDNIEPGSTLRVMPPSGIFTPKDLNADLLLFAAGSGITPLMSMAQTALEKGSGRVVMFYANRDEKSVIFAKELADLAATHSERFLLVHWLETVQGLPTEEQLSHFAAHFADYTAFVCGPGPFMDAAVTALRGLEFPRERRHKEKFASLAGNPFGDVEVAIARAEALTELDDPVEEEDGSGAAEAGVVGPISVEVDLDGNHYSYDDWDGKQVLLDFLEDKGIEPPCSCCEGNCGACAAVLLEGDLVMKNNHVLNDGDIQDGIRLVCQSQAVTKSVHISYDA